MDMDVSSPGPFPSSSSDFESPRAIYDDDSFINTTPTNCDIANIFYNYNNNSPAFDINSRTLNSNTNNTILTPPRSPMNNSLNGYGTDMDFPELRTRPFEELNNLPLLSVKLEEFDESLFDIDLRSEDLNELLSLEDSAPISDNFDFPSSVFDNLDLGADGCFAVTQESPATNSLTQNVVKPNLTQASPSNSLSSGINDHYINGEIGFFDPWLSTRRPDTPGLSESDSESDGEIALMAWQRENIHNDHNYYNKASGLMLAGAKKIEKVDDETAEVDVVNDPDSCIKVATKQKAKNSKPKKASVAKSSAPGPVRKGRKPAVKPSDGTKRPVGRPPKYPHKGETRPTPYQRKASSGLLDPEKRHIHNEMERKRRIELRNDYEELKEQLPDLTLRTKGRVSKVEILKNATATIISMNKDQERLEAKLAELRRYNQELLMRRSCLDMSIKQEYPTMGQ